MAEAKFIDATPLIAEYDKSIQWLKDNVKKLPCRDFSSSMSSVQMARKMLIDAPAADVRPVVLGTWKQNEELTVNACSECGYSFSYEGYAAFFNFCPCCGADMRGEAGT